MPFTITPNVAQYGGADWSNFIKTVPNCTPQSAQRIARADPNIGFFFYCRGLLVLDGHAQFNPGDAVFFSGAPWPGSAPQADIYQKDVFTMAYVMTNTSSLANAGCYTLADGRQFFDFVSVFAANLDGPPNVPVLSFTLPVNASLYDTDDVKKLQNLGITVLLSVVNNWSNAGWSEFTDQKAAQWFVDQLVAAVDRFGLDGIDIDDEYSIGTPTDTNLAMVTTLLRQALPGKIVSKALFDDSQYFGPTWNGHTLTGNLTYGWEMSYFDPNYAGRLQPYVDAGMGKNQLAIGVDTSRTDGPAAASFVRQNGYGGIMVFNVTKDSTSYLSGISNALFGQNTVAQPGCLV